ncbi:hypothetical protein G6321_00017110 [Bradyrhizobium barranii subsp. barranii]|uniref:Uncharacterized protein n=1 Tax=Bradyrhizobium barranii subsp. barranii TaxID=2823807 RepID=A0A7Z0Q646_9BRAD|nr:hypothetical protein [Bradyrhizobium barranii]UGX96762.1 hypothetical protein G6321_00017110 [Bradyrhizobium barranii subsp. barranii]
MASTRTDLGRKSAPLLTERYEVMFPAVLPHAIQVAAERALMTPAEYVRRSVIDKLLSDGIDLRRPERIRTRYGFSP